MGAEAIRHYIQGHFQAHAIKGWINPKRSYEIAESTPTQLRIRALRNSCGFTQTLFADLVTCKSLKYGEFRRVDLFWGMERKEKENGYRSVALTTNADLLPADTSEEEFTSNGDPIPVDAFMERSLVGRTFRKPRKEKAS